MSDSNSPAVPAYIFRGHVSAVHALLFFASNAYLASADSEGWLLIWSLSSKRAVAVWKAHEGGILGVKSWGTERLITHGRDHKLCVWRLRQSDFAHLDTKLPVDGADGKANRQPWLLHSIGISALNFCSFAICDFPQTDTKISERNSEPGKDNTQADEEAQILDPIPIVLAASNALDNGGIDFFHLPSERRVSKLPSDRVTQTGMVMALSLAQAPSTGQLTLVSGYEDGHTMVHVRENLSNSTKEWKWRKVLTAKPHSQPVLSLDVKLSENFYITSSADAVLAKFEIPSGKSAVASTNPIKSINTKHAGQQSLCMRSDGKIFATAGWDARIRVYSAKTMKELAVLKWHQDGCYAVAFAEIGQAIPVDELTREAADSSTELTISKSALDIIKQERAVRAQNTHWLAGGGKDGKISLWEIY